MKFRDCRPYTVRAFKRWVVSPAGRLVCKIGSVRRNAFTFWLNNVWTELW